METVRTYHFKYYYDRYLRLQQQRSLFRGRVPSSRLLVDYPSLLSPPAADGFTVVVVVAGFDGFVSAARM